METTQESHIDTTGCIGPVKQLNFPRLLCNQTQPNTVTCMRSLTYWKNNFVCIPKCLTMTQRSTLKLSCWGFVHLEFRLTKCKQKQMWFNFFIYFDAFLCVRANKMVLALVVRFDLSQTIHLPAFIISLLDNSTCTLNFSFSICAK